MIIKMLIKIFAKYDVPKLLILVRSKKYHCRHAEAVYRKTYLGSCKTSIVEHTAQKMKFSIKDFFISCAVGYYESSSRLYGDSSRLLLLQKAPSQMLGK